VNAGTLAYLLGAVLCALFGIRLPPLGQGPIGDFDVIALFVAIGIGAATFAASVAGALVAPRGSDNATLVRLAAFSSIYGALFGAWIVTGAGLAAYQLNLIDRDSFNPLSEQWLAIGTGLVAGVAIAITLRVWRSK